MLFRQGGSWIPTEGDGIIDKIRASWLSPLGLPDSGTYALRFPKKEVEQAISLLTYQQMFGMNVWDDTYAIPDHGQQLIRTSHHDVMHVEFRSSDDVAPFVQKMEEEGFDLPDHVPDETFKIPKWMQSR